MVVKGGSSGGRVTYMLALNETYDRPAQYQPEYMYICLCLCLCSVAEIVVQGISLLLLGIIFFLVLCQLNARKENRNPESLDT